MKNTAGSTLILRNSIPFFFCAFLLVAFPACKKEGDNPVTPPVINDSLGAGWTKKSLAAVTLVDIFFANNQVGYASGNRVYKSTDGGTNWQMVFDQQTYNLFVTPETKPFFVGMNSSLFTPNAAGTGLVACFNAVNSNRLTDVFFPDNNTGFFIKNDSLYKSINAGLSWNHVGMPLAAGYSYSSMFFTDNTNGWIIAGKKVYKTDGINIGSLLFVCDLGGQVYQSMDGGLSFTFKSALPYSGNWVDIHFLNGSTGFASKGRRIYRTTDGAATWTQVVNLGNADVQEIHFTDINHGWAACSDGTILVFRQ